MHIAFDVRVRRPCSPPGAAAPSPPVETPDPAAVPSGEPVAIGAEPTGPVTLIGEGQTQDLGWRYVIYESADGWCTELQLAEFTAAGCGQDPLPSEGEHIGAVAVETLENGVTPVDGIVSDEIFTVWLVDEQLGRVPATLIHSRRPASRVRPS